jgi:hypothetical protein
VTLESHLTYSLSRETTAWARSVCPVRISASASMRHIKFAFASARIYPIPHRVARCWPVRWPTSTATIRSAIAPARRKRVRRGCTLGLLYLLTGIVVPRCRSCRTAEGDACGTRQAGAGDTHRRASSLPTRGWRPTTCGRACCMPSGSSEGSARRRQRAALNRRPMTNRRPGPTLAAN